MELKTCLLYTSGYKDDAHALSGSAPTSGVQGSSLGADKSAASALLWLFRCGDRQGRFWVGSVSYTHLDVYKRQFQLVADLI